MHLRQQLEPTVVLPFLAPPVDVHFSCRPRDGVVLRDDVLGVVVVNDGRGFRNEQRAVVIQPGAEIGVFIQKAQLGIKAADSKKSLARN